MGFLIRYIVIIASATIMLVAGLVGAQSSHWRDANEPSAKKMKLIQDYTGTVPGAGNNLPRVEELKEKQGGWITWPGFIMMADGTSRIFIQTTQPVRFKQKSEKRRIVISFADTQVHLWNNRNPLITTHFNTPAKKIYLKRHRRKVELVIDLKTEAIPSVRQTEIEDGYHYLFIDFQPGDYPTESAPSFRPTFSGGGHQNTDGAPLVD